MKHELIFMAMGLKFQYDLSTVFVDMNTRITLCIRQGNPTLGQLISQCEVLEIGALKIKGKFMQLIFLLFYNSNLLLQFHTSRQTR